MVEEAAGTRMFEERKDKAKKTMGKKEERVDEITALLAEEITPKLDTLRTERRAFMQYQKASTELERCARPVRIRMDGSSDQDLTQGGPDRREGAGSRAGAP
jgi:structural maintenance of chromosome 2